MADKTDRARPRTVADFIAYWKASGPAERANYQLFIEDLTKVLDLPPPNSTTKIKAQDIYVIDRAVTNPNSGTEKFIDLYKAGCFVLETKQGANPAPKVADPQQHELITGEELTQPASKGHGIRGSKTWRRQMDKALTQARGYARHIEAETGEAPPFVIVVDIGYQFEIFADFLGRGTNYTPFPNPKAARFSIDDLADPDVQARLRAIWLDPHSLDRSKETAKVSKKIADQLAALARSYHTMGSPPEATARFLMQCIFAMFAEDIGIIEEDSFTDFLKRQRDHDDAEITREQLDEIFKAMNTGGLSHSLGRKLLQINGGLYAKVEALPVNRIQRGLLIDAAICDWREVEPAIFGTLIEHALDPKKRGEYGAHFTPREYVERLVIPTVIEPLREDFETIRATAYKLHDDGEDEAAFDLVRDFLLRLSKTRVLDPACGSGNFLYVALELLKELEAEVRDLLEIFAVEGKQYDSVLDEVDPSQFLGIELNPWAAEVAELVLWIGYLQQRWRATGQTDHTDWPVPVLKDYGNIQRRDAVLSYKKKTKRVDEDGQPVTRYDGVSTRRHPGTGEDVPDETARLQIYDYTEPAPAEAWPDAEFIVGNPPFIGASRMRERLGDGYTEALRAAYPKLPESIDFVMYWWDRAAALARQWNPKTRKGVRRFGLITTNSFRQTFNRRVAEPYLRDPKRPVSLLFAIPDHPWVDSEDGAAVRIAMTVGAKGRRDGRLLAITSERPADDIALARNVEFGESVGRIFGNLRVGTDVASALALQANEGLSSPGVKLHGSGFIVSPGEAADLGLGIVEGLDRHIRHYLNGRDMLQTSRNVMVIDLFGLSEAEAQAKFPKAMEHVRNRVKPARDINNRKSYRENWWIHGEPRSALRPALEGLPRYIATVETSKHRIFLFLDETVLPDNMLIAIASDDAAHLSILSSDIHVTWALAAGGTLEDRPRYNKSVIFDPFPFPDLAPEHRARLADLGERLDAHRKRVMAAHPRLTITQMYNVLEEYRALLEAGEGVLEGRSKQVYDDAEIGTLHDLHAQIDAATAEAYGWPSELSDEDILQRLVDLNRERAQEEQGGFVRYLRPDYQNPDGPSEMDLRGGRSAEAEEAVVVELRPWPKALPERMATVREALEERGTATPKALAKSIKGAGPATVLPFLDTLVATGLADKLDDGRYAA